MIEETFTKAIDILYSAKQNDVEIALNGDKLQLKTPEDKTIDKDLLAEIRANKKLIIDFLSNDSLKSTIISNNNHKITRFDRNVVSSIPLSFSQERLWFIDQLEGSLQYHLPAVLRLKGNLDRDALSKALGEIVNRHEILRTVYEEENGLVYQRVKTTGRWQLRESDGMKYFDDQPRLESYIQQITREPFDLAKDDMLRAELIAMGTQDHMLVVTMHHIASDASSMPVLVREVVALYGRYASGKELPLPVPGLQYADYAVWQRSHVNGSFLEEKLNYWKKQLEDVSPLQLPADYARPADGSIRGSKISFGISAELSRQVQALSQDHGATLYMTLLTAFNVLLYRYSGQEDICVGTSVAGRPQQELDDLIGFFVNTLALRSHVRGDMTFAELLQEVKTMTLEAYAHQEVPFEKVVETVVKERHTGLSPLFQVMLVLTNTQEVPELKLGELILSYQGYEHTTAKFDLTFFIKETKDGFKGVVQYNTDIYSSERIERMTSHFEALLSSVVTSPETAVGQLALLGKAEQDKLQTFGSSVSVYPYQATIADLFEIQAAQFPEREAVVFAGAAVSYKELNERSNLLAHELRGHGVKAETLVPLYTGRGIEMLIGILGIMKAGGVYVPIDTDYPDERVSYMLEDTGAAVAVSSGEYTSRLRLLSGGYTEVVGLDMPEGKEASAITNPVRSLKAEQLAYVIYTSGSTGKPKGVQVSHRNVVDYVYGLEERTGISACRSYALVSTIATDLGNTVLYSSLLFGGTLHLFTKETVSHIEALHEYFEEHRIDCLKIVPSHWKALSPEDGPPLLPERMLIFGGEALPAESAARIRRYSEDCRVINHYGPTETTIGKLLYEIKAEDYDGRIIPIGKPFSNTSVYVLSKEGMFCPIGIPGQLYIAGAGTARGYLRRSELTAEKFIQNPYGEAGEKMYATGDRVAYRSDGNITFIGRVDDQVKIRGYRVEPGEVGRILEESELVEQAVVLAREDKQGNKQLVGYIVPRGEYDRSGIQAYLKETLPEYMIPAYMLALTSLPLTANGKVDRKALPDPEGDQPEGKYIAPRNETEVKLAEIWQDVLEVEQVGVTDDFFELGGHSLLAVRLVSAIRKGFSRELPISDIFDYPTVGMLSERLSGGESEALLPSVKAVSLRPEHIPLSFSQERLWFIDRLEGSVQYHVPAVLRLKGELKLEILTRTLRSVIGRHEILRTVIREREGQGYQHIMTADSWQLEITEDLAYKEGTEGLSEYITSLIRKPFDLSADYMLRADLIKLDKEDHILVVTMHHIASDGWSRSILVKEVIALYEGYAGGKEAKLPELTLQYPDYAIWQRQYMQGEILDKKLGYWIEKLEGVLPLQLPTDFNRPAVQRSRGATRSFSIDQGLSSGLVGLSQENGATLYMTMLAVFNVLLYRYSGQEDICVGTPIAGRNQQELEGMIGFFVNSLAMRSRVNGEVSFIELLQEVKAVSLGAFAHQEVPFEKVVEAVVKERDMSRSPLFQVAFSFQNTPEVPELKLQDIRLTVESREHTTSKFDIILYISETSAGIRGILEYSTDLYKVETIERMISHYINLLYSIVSSPESRVSCLDMLGAAEKETLLVEFNANRADFPKNKNIVALFEEQVKKTPKATAIVFGQDQLTYKELDERSNQLARYLIKKGVNAETLVPVCIERSLEMVISILGILKAGGAYVPIDQEYPEDRISYMLEDMGASIILSSSAASRKLPGNSAFIIDLDGDWEQIAKEEDSNLQTNIRPEQLAYLIYTSGSTGKPKGVMIEHQGVVNLFYGQIKPLDLHPGIAVFQFASFSFDASCHEIFCTLLIGGQLIMADKTTQLDVSALVTVLDKHKVELITLPPSYHSVIQDELTNVKIIISAGEPLTANQASSILKKGIKLINAYGPTENTVSAILSESPLLSDSSITIGKPNANVQIYILDKNCRLNPIGVPGELYIGGLQLARGYLNQPELTAHSFVPNPFDTGKRMYRTGDIGRWLPDGNIEYLGRIQDDQVKVRGYRIELGEIEHAINKHPDIWQARVLAKTTKNGKELVAYYEKKKKIVLWPSTAEYLVDFVHDDLLYHAMADDKLRNEKYRNAFEKVVKDKVILEVGPGSEAILSRMCIEAGAKRVYCIEISDEPYRKATALIHDLQLDDKIKIIHSDVTKIDRLPEEIDLCISEIVGSIGGSEGAARLINHVHGLVKEPEHMIPAKSITKIAAITLPAEDFDFSFSPTGAYYARQLFDKAGREFDFRICLQNFPKRHLISNEGVFEYLDYRLQNPLEDLHEIFLEISASGTLNGFAVWLVLYCDEQEVIDSMKDRHIWLPVYFPVFWEGIDVNKGDYIKCNVIRTLSENGLSPDFRIEGHLYQNGKEPQKFEYISNHIINDFKSNGFYKKIFSSNELKVTKDINQTDLISYLKDKVPAYMIPSHFIPIEKFPVNLSGKIDDRLLLDMDGPVNEGRIYIAPESETEKRLALIWQELLEIDEVGMEDDFFELGGHSLLAMRVVSSIRKELNVEIGIRDLFIHPTINSLGVYLDAQSKGSLLPAMTAGERPEHIPLSFSQERLWFIDRLEGSTQYHLPAVLRLKGELNLAALEKTLRHIIDRHEVLRTVIMEHEGQGYQHIMPVDSWSLGIIEGLAGGEAGLISQIGALINRPFDLSADYMLRADLIKLGSEEHILAVTMHHIASDGWSTSILVKEVVAIYEGFVSHQPVGLPSLPIQYADYSIWQRRYMHGEVLQNKVDYWKKQLEGVSPLQLPTDYSRPTVQSSRGATRSFSIDQRLSSQLVDLSHRQGATLYMTLLAAFKVLLHRYSGQEDICVGTPVAGRNQQELEGLIGFFINTLALRSHVRAEKTFTELLDEVKTTTLDAYSHQEVPFEKVVDAVVKDRDMSRSPLFQVLFSLRNTPEVPELKLGGLSLTAESQKHTSAKFDLAFLMSETNTGIQGTVEFSTDLYMGETIERMIGHYINLLGSITASTEELVGCLCLMGVTEEETLVEEFNATEAVYPKDKSIVALFEEQVEKTPEAIAIVFEEQQLTYQELNEHSNQLARYLQKQGVKAETLVPICVERSLEMITGILGILKAGGAYVPIDPEYPQERISYMLEDTGASIVLSSKAVREKIKVSTAVSVIALDGDWDLISKEGSDNLEIVINAEQLAYVIYTSGSTGKPKGVMIEHRNVVSLVKGVNYVVLNEEDTLLVTGSPSFDATTFEYWGMLLNGGRLILCIMEDLLDSESLKANINKHEVNIMWFTSSWFNQLIDSNAEVFAGLRTVLVGGEKLSEYHIEKIRKQYPALKLINGYGPTENTTFSLTYPISDNTLKTPIPIGRPLNNRKAYVLTEFGQLSPIGVSGELCIGGAGLARGYLNRPELTAEKFTMDPFSKRSGERLYRTGDLGRWLADGNIEYLGRRDDQVKIRGYRIELGEIESVLNQSDQVHQGVVLAKGDSSGNKRLVGYVVPEGEFDKQAIQNYLSTRLPEYMVPSLWVELENLPLTANGKIDRKALPDPEIADMVKTYVAPRNETEAALALIWQELLNLEQVGIHDNFFELGGHSLLAMRVVSSIRKELNVEIGIRDLFIHPTIDSLGVYLDARSKGSLLPAIMVGDRPECIPLSFSQERLWFIDRLEGSVQYHMPAVFRLKGSLKPEILDKTIRTIIKRHEVLRTVILEHDGQGYQYIMAADSWSLGIIEEFAGSEAVLSLYIGDLISKPFDLSADYMLRADLIKLGSEEHILAVTMHHIASDGWSTSILVKEVIALYEGYAGNTETNLQALKVQYADYAIWQRQYLQGEVLGNKIGYWKEKLEGVTSLQLPTDYNRPAIQRSRGTTFSFNINTWLSVQLVDLSHRQGATLYMTLLAAFKVLLYRYSGQEDICVGTPIAGRNQQELEGLIGFFVNTLALRSRVRGEMAFSALLEEVKGTTLEAYGHQEVPFEKVVEAVVKERDMSRSPLFQVLFSLQNTPEVPEMKLGELSLTAESQKHTSAKFDFSLFIRETSTGIQGTVEYATDLYREETIERMISHYTTLLSSIITTPETLVSRIDMLSRAEERTLLKEFNATVAEYPKDKSIVDLFEEQVIKSPQAVAIVFEEQQLTYQELNERSNQVGRYLQKQGVKAETLVPICVERSLEMITGILGILKAGGAYVPIDPEYPQGRISYMLEDTGASIVLSSKAIREKIKVSTAASVIALDGDWDLISKEGSGNLEIVINAEQLAYVIYTSGSTGKPKGVMIEHRSACSFINWCRDEFSSGQFNIVYASTSVCFDLSIFELFYPLSIGKPVRIIENGLAISNYLAKDSNILINTVPSVIEHLLNEKTDLSRVSIINMAGEPIPLRVLEGLNTTNIAVRNLYGPTEDTTYSTMRRLEQGKPITIGKPISNTQVYILGIDNQLSPIGVIGELCIGGAGLAREYLNRPELTAEKFIMDPFSKGSGERLYRTGDLGRWLADGNIEYLGRKDDQVKIRGYRIELGEIESVLNQNEQVHQGVVLAKGDSSRNKRLVGYVVPKGEFDKQAIQNYLSTRLPEYMVPSLWIELEHVPLTANGKIDRKALPDPEIGAMVKTYVAPQNETEAKLAEIWQELLGLDRVGIYDNFFELGGHSLLAMRVVSAIRRELDVELGIRDLFVHTDIAGLGAYIDEQNKGSLLPVITAAERPEYIPLSFSQERLWFIDRLEGSVHYHMPAVLRLKGNLKPEILDKTIRTIIDRHEVLRTVIREHEGRGYQHILAADSWTLGIAEDYKDSTEGLSGYISGLIGKPFNLSGDYMLRADLIRLSPEDHVLVVTMHHIASDGWSRSILVKEVVALYEGYAGNTETALPQLVLQYADYSIWQQKYMQGQVLEDKLNYWRTKLGDVATLQMPTDYNRPLVQSSKGSTCSFKIEQELSAKLLHLSHRQGATFYITLLAAFKVLLYRYSGQEDICVGTPIAGRNQHELEGLIGFFINTLALRSQLSGDMTFSVLLQDVKETTLEAYAHQEVPFEKVVDAVVKIRDMSRNPLFQVLFILQNIPDVPDLKLGELSLSSESQEHTTTQFDITFTIRETNAGTYGNVEYSTALYREDTIERMIGHYINLLKSIAETPEKQVSHLRMLSFSEEETLMQTFNDTSEEYPKDKTLIDMFEEQAVKSPEAIAVIFEEGNLSYKELHERSNQLAHYLQKKGVKAETLVPICVERGLEMITGILGILKAGGAYVPIDPDYPQDRISYMLEDTGAKLVLSSKACREKLTTGAAVIEIDGDWEQIAKENSGNQQTNISPDQLAYVIYTSGSTGRPKGVMIGHRSIVNLLTSISGEVDFSSNSSFISVTTYSFDICYLELYMPLIHGGKLVIVSRETASDGFRLQESLSVYQPTHIQGTPSTWQLLSEAGWTNPGKVKMLIGGEAVKEGIKEYLAKMGEVWNVYGPTETTIWSTIKKLATDEKVTIGKPISNTRIYLLNADQSLSPVGVMGEIYIGGDGLARGYLNRPELTAEKFINDPFSTTPGARLYRTGDLGRWLPDGNIEHLGRIDEQVKIRGYRIELGEIESVLNADEGVSQGVVLAKEDKQGTKRLIGYVVPEGEFDKQRIQFHLSEKLPEYMVPSLWVALESIPLTPNGKIDRKALPDPEIADITAVYTAPRNEREIKLAGIWQKLLDVERVGIYDNFFELGGHSLLAMRVVAAIRKKLNIELGIKDLFVHPNIADLSAYLETNDKKKLRSLIPINTSGNKRPLYIICGAGGTVFKFREFVQLLNHDQPVYGLQQSADNDNVENFPDTIEGIAARYIEEILLENPHGPYALAGHCLGGTIAVEMANQLEAMGKKVSLLAMFDANVKEKKEMVHASWNNFYHIPATIKKITLAIPIKIKFELFLLIKHPKQALQYKIRKVKPLFDIAEPKPGNIEQEIFEKLTLKLEKALSGYEMKSYNGDILLFTAMENYFFIDSVNKIIYKKLDVNYNSKQAWKKYARSVKNYEVKGEHSTIFDAVNATEFSQTLQRHLDENLVADQVI